jgi:hypothetical protein
VYQLLSFVGKGSILEALEDLHERHLPGDMNEHPWITYLTGFITAALQNRDSNVILQSFR